MGEEDRPSHPATKEQPCGDEADIGMGMGGTHVVHTLSTDPGKDRAVAGRPNSPCRVSGIGLPTTGREDCEPMAVLPAPEQPERLEQPVPPDPEVPSAVCQAEEPFRGVIRPVEAVQGLKKHLHRPCQVAVEPAPPGLSPRRVKHPAS